MSTSYSAKGNEQGNVLRPYKIYRALLTQSGGVDDFQSITSGELTIGRTYQILDDGGSGWDFTNVGAPNNDLNTFFVATGTTPNNWGTGVYLEYNLSAPVVKVLENTIGNIVWSRINAGAYIGTLNNAFPSNKYFALMSPIGFDSGVNYGGGGEPYTYYRMDDNSIIVNTLDYQLLDTPIEIIVYN